MNFAAIFQRVRWLTSLVILIAGGFLASHAEAAETADADSLATIYLTNGSFAAGKLLPSPDADHLVWQSPAFTGPFTFPIDAVNVVHFPVPAKVPRPAGEWCFELAGGDVLFGSLVSLDANTAVIEVGELGRLTVERGLLVRMFRWSGGEDLLYFGPSGIRGWQSTGKTSWREEAGHLIADESAATIRRDFSLPPRACFEFELSWTERPDFQLTLAAAADPKSTSRAFRFEVWGNQIVVQRETEREADVAAITDIDAGPGRIHFLAFLDQETERLLIVSSDGRRLADLTVTSPKPEVLGGVELTNLKGNIRLERLRISRWNGEAPRVVDANMARIHTVDGDVAFGEIESYDATNKEFVLAANAKAHRLSVEKVQDVVLARGNDAEAKSSSMHAVFLTGLRISGDLVRIDEQGVWLKRAGIREPFVAPLGSLHALTVLKKSDVTPNLNGRGGRLEVNGVRLRGCLVDGQEGEVSCLVWQPTHSHTASPLVRGVSGRIVYRDPPPTAKPQAQATRGAFGGVRLAAPIRVLGRSTPQRITTSAVPRRRPSGTFVLHLRSGDTFPCTAVTINEQGVTLKSDVTDATFVPHDRIKVLELMPEAAPVAIASSKKERLLTLPRMQRDNPPTHLIRAYNGDYLRGRLIAMNDKELQVEIRLETTTVQRENIARILWLHPETPENENNAAAEQSKGVRVQALPADGNRLTFVAEQMAGTVLSGRSELLGQCRVDVREIDQLLIGAAIEQAASSLAFHQWKLTPALEPLATEESAGVDNEGLGSALVGKPAPDFELDLLEGGKFDLAAQKGQILVLDFWASWCAPCLQIMPQVDEVAREFAGENVKLVSVNLQEQPERIRTVLERLGVKCAVALDRDGLIAERYGAITIPQTVIIDRDGNVARVYVTASSRFDEQLRAVLKEMISGEATMNDE